MNILIDASVASSSSGGHHFVRLLRRWEKWPCDLFAEDQIIAIEENTNLFWLSRQQELYTGGTTLIALKPSPLQILGFSHCCRLNR